MKRGSIGRIKELQSEIDLGTYNSEANRIKAELTLTARLHGHAMNDSGSDWYIADVKFYTNPVWQGHEEGFSVNAHYSLNVLDGIFMRMKRAESGFEEILMPPCDHNYKWEEQREVMKCILSLEDQVAHIPEERKKASKARYKWVHEGIKSEYLQLKSDS